MPFDRFDDVSPAMKLGLAFIAIGLLWVGFQSGLLTAIAALGLTSPTVLGLALLAVFAYWAFDELEDDDDASAVISKTADRAESATGGLLDSTAALVVAGGTIAATVGMQFLDGAAVLLEVAMGAPLAAANIGTLGAVLAALFGLLSLEGVVIIGAVLLVGGLIARRRKRMGA